MMKGKKIIIPFFCAASIFLAPAIIKTEAQSDSEKKSVPIRSTDITIRRGGWLIPKAMYKTGSKKTKQIIEGINVEGKALTPNVPVVDYEDYYIHSETELVISPNKRKILAMSALSVKDKVFAYAIRYTPYYGENSSVGAVFEVFFVDRDGDGVFEERVQSIDMPPLPEWVKNSNSNMRNVFQNVIDLPASSGAR